LPGAELSASTWMFGEAISPSRSPLTRSPGVLYAFGKLARAMNYLVSDIVAAAVLHKATAPKANIASPIVRAAASRMPSSSM
jgi:hypothetical protein